LSLEYLKKECQMCTFAQTVALKLEIEEVKKRHEDKAHYLPLIRHPVKMAMARAIRRALKRAFPLFPPEEG